jgi:hypothetical protein
MKKRLKLLLLAATAGIAFSVGMSVAVAETLACRKCRIQNDQCIAAGGGDTCWFNYEACLVRNRCWVE